MNTIIITGGTSDIGHETIKLFNKRYNIIFTYNKNKKKSKEIEKSFKAKGFKVNLNDLNSIEKFFKKIKSNIIVSLIHIAAEKPDREILEKMSQNKIIKQIKTNCIGTTILLKKTIQLMKKNKNNNKNIIMISSQSAKFGGNKISVYSASKAFIDGLNISLSKELPSSIKINNITLGKIDTSGLIKSFKKSKNLTKDIPLKRLGKPSEVAKTIRLIIEEFSYLTGSDIKLTGGR
jgi:NAD(P)-dependent dehydrogenase (short-subunit alcohol dehydrogenase family)